MGEDKMLDTMSLISDELKERIEQVLRQIKEQTPELTEVLSKFAIAQEEYDSVMLAIITAQTLPVSTYGIAESPRAHHAEL